MKTKELKKFKQGLSKAAETYQYLRAGGVPKDSAAELVREASVYDLELALRDLFGRLENASE